MVIGVNMHGSYPCADSYVQPVTPSLAELAALRRARSSCAHGRGPGHGLETAPARPVGYAPRGGNWPRCSVRALLRAHVTGRLPGAQWS